MTGAPSFSPWDALAGIFTHGPDGAESPEADENRAILWPHVWEGLGDLSGARALDFGCGTGPLARAMAARGAAQVWGVDTSPAMLAVARGQGGRPVYSPDLPSGSLDAVASVHVLEFIQGADAVLGALAVRLAPGGRLVLAVHDPDFVAADPLGRFSVSDEQVALRISGARDLPLYSRPEAFYVQTLARAGLTHLWTCRPPYTPNFKARWGIPDAVGHWAIVLAFAAGGDM